MLRNLIVFLMVCILTLNCAREWKNPAETDNNLNNRFPSEGLIAYYPFNGNSNDESGHGNTATPTGVTLTSDRFNFADRAYSFDGVDDYFVVEGNPSVYSALQALTICVWIYPTGWYDGWSVLLSKSGSSRQWQFRLFISNVGNIYFSLNDTDIIAGQCGINLDTWSFIAATFNGNQVHCYYNSTLLGTVPFKGQFYDNTFPLEIGRDRPYSTEYYIGKLDDIRIYNRALAANEVIKLFHENGW